MADDPSDQLRAYMRGDVPGPTYDNDEEAVNRRNLNGFMRGRFLFEQDAETVEGIFAAQPFTLQELIEAEQFAGTPNASAWDVSLQQRWLRTLSLNEWAQYVHPATLMLWNRWRAERDPARGGAAPRTSTPAPALAPHPLAPLELSQEDEDSFVTIIMELKPMSASEEEWTTKKYGGDRVAWPELLRRRWIRGMSDAAMRSSIRAGLAGKLRPTLPSARPAVAGPSQAHAPQPVAAEGTRRRKEPGQQYSIEELDETPDQRERLFKRRKGRGIRSDRYEALTRVCRTCLFNSEEPKSLDPCSRGNPNVDPGDEACDSCNKFGICCITLDGKVLNPRLDMIATGVPKDIVFFACIPCRDNNLPCDRARPCFSCRSRNRPDDCEHQPIEPVERGLARKNTFTHGSAYGVDDPQYFLALGYGPWGIGTQRPPGRPDIPGPMDEPLFYINSSKPYYRKRRQVEDHIERHKRINVDDVLTAPPVPYLPPAVGKYKRGLFTDKAARTLLAATMRSPSPPSPPRMPETPSMPPADYSAAQEADALTVTPEKANNESPNAPPSASRSSSRDDDQQGGADGDQQGDADGGDQQWDADGGDQQGDADGGDQQGEAEQQNPPRDPGNQQWEDEHLDNPFFPRIPGLVLEGNKDGEIQLFPGVQPIDVDVEMYDVMDFVDADRRTPPSPPPVSGPRPRDAMFDGSLFGPRLEDRKATDLFPAGPFRNNALATISSASIFAYSEAGAAQCDDGPPEVIQCLEKGLGRCADAYHEDFFPPFYVCKPHNDRTIRDVSKWDRVDVLRMRAYACTNCLLELYEAMPYMQTGTKIFGEDNYGLLDPHAAMNENGKLAGGYQGRTIFGLTGCRCAYKLTRTILCKEHRRAHSEKMKSQARRLAEWRVDKYDCKVCPVCKINPGTDEFEFRGEQGGENFEATAYFCMICHGVVMMPDWAESSAQQRLQRKALMLDVIPPEGVTFFPPAASLGGAAP